MRRMTLSVLACAIALAGCGGSQHHASARHLAPGPAQTTTTSTSSPVYRTPWGLSAHSPTFGLRPPGLKTAPAPSSTPTVAMYDSVSISVIPSHPPAVAGYLFGNFPNFNALVSGFPSAIHVPIVIHGDEIVRGVRMVCFDIEPGDGTPSEGGPWARAELAAGVTPCEYENLSTLPQVKASIAAARVPLSRVFTWVADWTFVPHLDAGAQATQWTDHYLNRNLDASVATRAFLGLRSPAPAPRDLGGPQHYERYDATFRRLDGQRMRERNTVMTWDSRGCQNPVRRPVCQSSRAHLQQLLGRDQAVYRRQTRAQRDQTRTPGRIQGLDRRLSGRGVVRRWL